MKKQKRKYKRLIFNVSEKLHHDIKIASALQNITMTEYVLHAAIERLVKEQEIIEKKP